PAHERQRVPQGQAPGGGGGGARLRDRALARAGRVPLAAARVAELEGGRDGAGDRGGCRGDLRDQLRGAGDAERAEDAGGEEHADGAAAGTGRRDASRWDAGAGRSDAAGWAGARRDAGPRTGVSGAGDAPGVSALRRDAGAAGASGRGASRGARRRAGAGAGLAAAVARQRASPRGRWWLGRGLGHRWRGHAPSQRWPPLVLATSQCVPVTTGRVIRSIPATVRSTTFERASATTCSTRSRS